jgi:hypothetical protein
MAFKIPLFTLIIICFSSFAQKPNQLQPQVLIVQPIVVQSDEGTHPASMALPEDLVDKAYLKAGVDFHFLEPLFYNNTRARDGQINLDQIVIESQKAGLIKGQDDMVNMFFVNAVDGKKGPLGRGMMGGNITFIALGDPTEKNDDELIHMQAFVIAHEVGHNLSLKHAVNDPNVPNSIPNIQGDGPFKDRIDPKYSLNDYQIKVVQKSPLVHPRIEFLSGDKAAKAILDESYEPYFSQLQKREISAFVQEELPTEDLIQAREFAREKFSSAVTPFTENEKKCISFVVKKVNTLLQKNKVSLMSNHPWRFLKIEDWLCGGFAHTRGTYIILSQRHIDHLSTGWSDQMTDEEEQTLIKRFGGLLVHEQMHSLQRTYKSKFMALFTDHWNFKHAEVTPEKSIQLHQVSNPDAPIAEWLIPIPEDETSYYWIRTLLKEGPRVPAMGKDFVDTVFAVQERNGAFIVKRNVKGQLLSTGLSGIESYKNSFPIQRGFDHPNEISAYMFSEYFKALASKTNPFEAVSTEALKNSKAFVAWVNQEMKE